MAAKQVRAYKQREFIYVYAFAHVFRLIVYAVVKVYGAFYVGLLKACTQWTI